jgi:FkbM family methyltransferase
MPFIAKTYLEGYQGSTSWRASFARLPWRFAFRVLATSATVSRGQFEYRLGEDCCILNYDARNTQFHSIYSSKYVCGYEPETAALLDLILGGEDVFYDIGSNWGHFSLYAASCAAYHGAIHAFEPNPATFCDLCGIIDQSGLGKRIIPHNVGLSETTSAGHIWVPDGVRSGRATVSTGGKGTEISLARLDDLEVRPPNVIKMDVENHEYEALRGASRILTAHRPLLIFESWNDSTDARNALAPLDLLRSVGYRTFLPALWCNCAGGNHYAGYGEYHSKNPETTLALFEFLPEHRCLLPMQANIFACHRERFDTIRAAFDAGHPA